MISENGAGWSILLTDRGDPLRAGSDALELFANVYLLYLIAGIVEQSNFLNLTIKLFDSPSARQDYIKFFSRDVTREKPSALIIAAFVYTYGGSLALLPYRAGNLLSFIVEIFRSSSHLCHVAISGV